MKYLQKRVCQKCGKVLPLEEFPMTPEIASGYAWKCRKCATSDIKAWIKKTNKKSTDRYRQRL